MKLALYMQHGTTEVIITPETDWEKDTLEKIPTGGKYTLYRGPFYECQGGWIRQGTGFGSGSPSRDESLIFRIDVEKEEE